MPVVKELEVRIAEFVSPLARVMAGIEQVYGLPETPAPDNSVTSVADGAAIIALPTSEFLIWLAVRVRNGEAARQEKL